MPKIIIVRHGQSRANVSGRSGNAGTWLTQQGRGDASRASRSILRDTSSDILKKHGRNLAVVSSSFRRARHTAKPLARALGVKVQIQSGVHERDLGHLRKKDASTWQDEPGYFMPGTKSATGPGQLNPDYRPKNGESLKDVQKRAVAGLHAAIKKNPGKDIVLFTHGHTARALEAHIRGKWSGTTNWKNGEHRAYDYEPKTNEMTISELVDFMIEGMANSSRSTALDLVYNSKPRENRRAKRAVMSLEHQAIRKDIRVLNRSGDPGHGQLGKELRTATKKDYSKLQHPALRGTPGKK